MPSMPIRVVMLASECEPWAKTGGLADVVDALARALGELGHAGRDAGRRLPAALPGRAPAGDDRADHQPARAGSAGAVGQLDRDDHRCRRPTATGSGWSITRPRSTATASTATPRATTPDNAWRFGLFCRAALEALRADGRPVDVLHLHDWHTGPAAIYRDVRYADDPIVGDAAILMTLHNLAYHGWTPRSGARPARAGTGRRRRRARRRRDRPAPERDRAGRARQHRLARVSRPRR